MVPGAAFGKMSIYTKMANVGMTFARNIVNKFDESAGLIRKVSDKGKSKCYVDFGSITETTP